MPCITASASRSAGIALGEVNEVTSILAKPHRLSVSIIEILSAVSMKVASFWKPSRVATSCINRRFIRLLRTSNNAARAPLFTGLRIDAVNIQDLVSMLTEGRCP
ncbi:hypothetical protein D3C80_1740720 [compost metagenome]